MTFLFASVTFDMAQVFGFVFVFFDNISVIDPSG